MPVLENPRHERFAQELAKGKTATEAYELAGYKPNDGNAATLKGNQRVEARVAELLGRAAAKAEVTLETLAKQLDEDRELAHHVEQPGAAVQATMGKAKLYGLLKDKQEITGKNGEPIKVEDVSARELLLGRITGIAERRGQDGSTGKPH